MAKRKSLAFTRSRIFALTSKLSEAKSGGCGVTSKEVVDEFMKEIATVPLDERDDIVRLGLMVLAGRVTTTKPTDGGQLDIFSKEGLPHFVDLRIKNDGNNSYLSQRFDVRKLTPNSIVKHCPINRKGKAASKRDRLIEWAHKKIEAGFGDIPVESSI